MKTRRQAARRPKKLRRAARARSERPEERGKIELLVHDLGVQTEEALGKNQQLEDVRLELEKAVVHYRDLFENAPAAYLTLDSNGLVLDANLTSVRLFGIERQRLLGKPLSVRVVEEDRNVLLNHLRRCRHGGSAKTELSLIGEHEPFPVELDSRSMSARSGANAQFRTGIVDLRDRKAADAEKERALRERRRAEERERMARAANVAKDQFIAELSHELRTPLTPVLAAVTGLLGSGDVPATLRPTIEMIRRNIEIESRLINDLLDVSRIARQQLRIDPDNVDAHEVLRETASTLQHEIEAGDVEFTLELDARDSWLRADPLRLRQIFWNLLANALHSVPPGGHIRVSSANIDRDLRILVRDDGIGIDPDKLESIFLPFSTGDRRRPKGLGVGLGLGLAIVKGLVEAHDGRILALSKGPGHGATLVVELPVAPAGRNGHEATRATESKVEAAAAQIPVAAPGEAVERPVARRQENRKRILLVEDDPDTGGVLTTFLELEGYEVRLAPDAATAVELAAAPFDVLVCDIGLPDGSGLELLQRISAEKPIKAIAVTGYGSPRDLDLSAKAGFALHLTKPVAVEDLIAAIESLGEATGETGPPQDQR